MPLELCFWNIPHQNHRGALKSKSHALTLNLHLGWGQKPAFEQAGVGVGWPDGQGGCLVALLGLCRVLPGANLFMSPTEPS